MALSPTQQSLCNSINQQFDGVIAPIVAGKTTYKSKLRRFKEGLRNTTFTPQNQIDSELNSLKTASRTNMPGSDINAMNELKSVIDNCEYLSLFNPVSALVTSANGMFNKIDSLISNSGITVPEFGLGAIADELEKLLKGASIPGGSILSELFEKADKLIQCLDAICSEDVSTKIEILENLVTDYNLDDSYDIDYGTIYSDAGLTSSEIQGMNTAITGIRDIKSEASESVNNAVSAAKSFTKAGGFI
jgi:hypothetical protein